jgi:NADH-quinone oxidoreductase subunit G
MAHFTETAGTWDNLAGLWQSASGAVAPPGEARPAWKVWRVLSNLLDVDGFDYDDAFEIRDQLKEQCTSTGASGAGDWPARDSQTGAGDDKTVFRLGDVPAYACDALVRRAAPLQDTADAEFEGLQIGPELAGRLGLVNGQRAQVSQQGANATAQGTFIVKVVDSMASDCVRLPSGIIPTAGLGASHGAVDVSAA